MRGLPVYTLLIFEGNRWAECWFGAQSFTSLMAVLRQDIKRVSSFSRCINGGTFPWSFSNFSPMCFFSADKKLFA